MPDEEPGTPVPPGGEDPGVVTLTIPCAPEYVGTARLTILGVASRMGFSYDQVEDIRLAVGEACTNAIDRVARGGNGSGPGSITIRSHVETGRLTIEVEDHTGNGAAADGDAQARPVEEIDPQELGALLMEILVDEVAVEPLPEGGTLVRLTKYTAEG
uniref:Serine-protein kinase RsbW n=1 Tax=uncultured Armatimonadetes bacterium TaxID=157466 RepID=A0A6J4HJ13_9BACT|nr:Serine-protein kinase RsbW [uncultured Armatimonadetes bacterium]